MALCDSGVGVGSCFFSRWPSYMAVVEQLFHLSRCPLFRNRIKVTSNSVCLVQQRE